RLPSALRERFSRIVDQYKSERRSKQDRAELQAVDVRTRDLEDDSEPARRDADDPGGNETFFAWFCRGEGPAGVLSGAQLALRLNSARFGLSSFFLDNWLASLLGTEPGTVFLTLHGIVGGGESDLRHSLETLAGSAVSVKKRNTHKELFLAFQFAGL